MDSPTGTDDAQKVEEATPREDAMVVMDTAPAEEPLQTTTPKPAADEENDARTVDTAGTIESRETADHHESHEYSIRMVLAEASDLVAADESGLSDPFAIVELVDTSHKRHKVVVHHHKPYSHKSKIVFDTLDPVWDEHFHWEGIKVRPEKLSIKVKLFDADMLEEMLVSTDPLGEIELPVDELPVNSDEALLEDNWRELDISPHMFAIKGSINFRATLHELTTEERERKAAEKKLRHERHEAKKAADAAEAIAAAQRRKEAHAHRRKLMWIRRRERLQARVDSARQYVVDAVAQARASSARAMRAGCASCMGVFRGGDAATAPEEPEAGEVDEAAAEALRQEAERQAALHAEQEKLAAQREREAQRVARLRQKQKEEEARRRDAELAALKRKAQEDALWAAAEKCARGPVEAILGRARELAAEHARQEYEKVLKEREAKREAALAGDEGALKYMVEVWRADALAGGLEAQISMGDAYLRGRGVEVDLDQALHWWTMSAAQGDLDSQKKVVDMWAAKAKGDQGGGGDGEGKWAFHMGHVFETGLYVAVNLTKAMAWYNTAVKRGHPEARGRALSCERGLAAKGDAEGQVHLGTSYWKGDGVPEDKAMAIEWWRKAALQRNANAQFYLGCATLTGEGMPNGECDAKEAVVWFQRASDQHHRPAQKQLADHWRGRARKGDAESQVLLGKAYAAGRGVQRSMDKALEWWGEAAQKHESQPAMMLLADVFYNARAVTKNKQRGLEWWTTAAELGNAEALFLAGRAHASGGGCADGEEGDGVAADPGRAVRFWQRGADAGHRDAQFSLGNAYFYGSGIAKDIAMAKHWWSLSSQLGDTDAQHMLGIAHRHEERAERKLLALDTQPQSIQIHDEDPANSPLDIFHNGQVELA